MDAGERTGGTVCSTVPPLQGFSVGITADRRRVEQGNLLERAGARVVYGGTLDVDAVRDMEGLRRVTEDLLAKPPEYLVVTTAIGIRGWLTAAEAWGLDEDFVVMLRGARIVTRGPKGRGAVQAAGLDVWWDEPSERLCGAVDHLLPYVAGATVAVQLYGREDADVLAPLVAAGARVVPVPVYRWSVPSDTAPAARIVESVLAHRLAAVTFTSPPAVEHFVELARRAHLDDDVVGALNGPVVAACVGPVTAEAARRVGVHEPCFPAVGRLGLMVRALEHRLHATHRHLESPEGAHVMLQGDTVVAGGGVVTLSQREAGVLAVLARRPGSVVPRPRLLTEVWGPGAESEALDATVGRLRRSLAPAGLEIRSVVRRGLLLAASPTGCPPAGRQPKGYEEVSAGRQW